MWGSPQGWGSRLSSVSLNFKLFDVKLELRRRSPGVDGVVTMTCEDGPFGNLPQHPSIVLVNSSSPYIVGTELSLLHRTDCLTLIFVCFICNLCSVWPLSVVACGEAKIACSGRSDDDDNGIDVQPLLCFLFDCVCMIIFRVPDH
jgi:hypothetical protein